MDHNNGSQFRYNWLGPPSRAESTRTKAWDIDIKNKTTAVWLAFHMG